MEKQNYRYYAFISYSRKDEKIAKWLQDKLEAYRLPSVLQKQYENAPKKIKVFRDKTDIVPAGTVREALNRELQDSKKLIVVCSPESAKSEWVEKEVQDFLKIGHKTEDIIPFVTSGTPNGKDDNCYTPTLANLEMNAAVVSDVGRRDAFIGVLAALLEIKLDEIKKREQQRLVRKITLRSALGVVAACLFFATIWFFTPHTKYYADYITRYSLPEGIPELELTKKQIAKIPGYYEITTKWGIFNLGNKPVKLARKNYFGVILPEQSDFERQNRPKYATFEYRNKFSLSSNKNEWGLQEAKFTFNSNVHLDDKQEHEIWLDFSKTQDGVIVDFYYPSNERMQKSLSNDFLSDANIFYSDISAIGVESAEKHKLIGYYPEVVFFMETSSIFRWKVRYDENGFDRTVEFFNKNNESTSDKNGIHGCECKYTDKGQISECRYLYDVDVPEIANRSEYKYNDLCELVEFSYIKADNNYAFNEVRNFSYKTLTYDKEENSFEIRFFDRDSNPTKDKYFDTSFAKVVYDENGCEKETRTDYWTIKTLALTKGLPTSCITESYGSKTIQNTVYDERSNIVESKQELEDGTLLFYRKSKESFDGEEKVIEHESKQMEENGKLLEFSNFNVYDKYGRHIKEYNVYNGNNTVEKNLVKYFGENRILSFEQEEDNVLKSRNTSFITESGKLLINFSQGEYTFDNNGRLVHAKFRNEDGSSARSVRLGFSEYNANYNPNGLLENETFKWLDGTLALSPIYGYSQFVSEIDLTGTYYKWGRYLDSNGNLTKNIAKGYAWFKTEELNDHTRITYYYDENNRCVYEVTYENNEYKQKVMYVYEQNQKKKYILDEKSRVIYSRLFDLNDNPIKKQESNYSYMTIDYTDEGSVVSRYDENDVIVVRLTKNENGIQRKYEKFESGNLNVFVEYDELGRGLKVDYFDSNKNIIKTRDFEYGKDGSVKISDKKSPKRYCARNLQGRFG